MFIILWDVKEPTHLSLRVGHVVPGVVVCLLAGHWEIPIARGGPTLSVPATREWHGIDEEGCVQGKQWSKNEKKKLVYIRSPKSFCLLKVLPGERRKKKKQVHRQNHDMNKPERHREAEWEKKKPSQERWSHKTRTEKEIKKRHNSPAVDGLCVSGIKLAVKDS